MTGSELFSVSAVVSLGNLGGCAIIGKWLLRSVNKHNETIPVMLESLKNMSEGIKELFASRNEHAIEIAEIKTGIDYCEACNAHRHNRSTDRKPASKASR